MTEPSGGPLLPDPWAVPPPSDAPADHRSVAAVTTALVALAGPVVALVDDGPSQRWAALWIALAVVLWTAVLSNGRVGEALRLASLVAIAAVAAAAAVPIAGRAPLAVALVGALAVDAALRRDVRGVLRWVPPGRTTRTTPTAGLALAPLVAAEVLWIRNGSVVVFAVLVVAGLTIVGLHGLVPEGGAAVDATTRRVVVAVTNIVGIAVVVGIALPLLYLPGLVGRVAGRVRHPTHRWDDDRSAWNRRSVTVTEQRRDAHNMFASVDGSVRAGRNRFAIAAIVVIAVTALVVRDQRLDNSTNPSADASGDDAFNFRFSRTPFTERDNLPYAEREAFRGDAYASDVERDQRNIVMVTDAIGGTRVQDFDSETFNVRDGERRTLSPTCTCPRLVVWFVGGSAAFGIGQRDDHTVASALVRRAQQDGLGLEVRNFGTPAWTIWQEYQAVAARLATGDGDPPDLVVFYDGFNDVVGTLFESALRGPDAHTPTLLTNADVWDVVEQGRTVEAAGGGKALGLLAARKYRDVQDLALDTAERHGARAEFFLQPDALASADQRRAAEISFGPDLAIIDQVDMDAALDANETALAGAVHDLRRMFSTSDDLMFIDSVHQDERAAAEVAGRIYEQIAPELRQQAAGRPAR